MKFHYRNTMRIPNVKAMWGAMTASLMGDQLNEIALIWLVYEYSGSAKMVSLTLLAQRVPVFIAGLAGGVVSDRWDRFRVYHIFNVTAALVVGTVPVLYTLHTLSVTYLLVVAALIGTARSFGVPAFSGIVPLLVSGENFLEANSLLDSTKRVARSVGPGIGGLVTSSLSVVVFFVADAVSYLLSSLFLMSTKPIVRQQLEGRRRTTFWEDLREVLKVVSKEKVLFLSILGFGLYNLSYAVGYWIGLPVLAKSLSGNVNAYSYLVAAFGVGGWTGNFLIRYVRIKELWILAFSGFAIVGCGFLLMSLASNLTSACLFGFFSAMGLPLMDIALPTMIREIVSKRDDWKSSRILANDCRSGSNGWTHLGSSFSCYR